MSRTSYVLDMAIALVLGALAGMYLLRQADASSALDDAALRAAVARRDGVKAALERVKLEIAEERRRQGLANVSVALPQIAEERRQPTDARRPKQWHDFPCALRDLKVAKVTKTCEVSCRDPACGRARDLCTRLFECEAVLVRDALLSEATGDLSGETARLVRDVPRARANDASMGGLLSSRWWQSKALQSVHKPRTYLVVSYGGCGSKMLAGWLSSLKQNVKRVYHLHDPTPPSELHELPLPRAKPSMQRDFRARRFPGSGKFRTDTPLVSDIDDFRVLFIFKDPVEALVSRYGYGHCLHLGGDCGDDEKKFPTLDAYARAGNDRMGLLAFFERYTTGSNRSFPIVLLNYHKLWDNLPALMQALGVPASQQASFPERTETVRNDLTAAAENKPAHSEATRRGLDVMYAPIISKIRALPAVSLV